MALQRVNVDRCSYQGWNNSYRIANAQLELFVTADVGPRIIAAAFLGGDNLFFQSPRSLGKSGEPVWILRGGHRLWVAPEDPVLTYRPDNEPVGVEVLADGVQLTEAIDSELGLRKQLLIRLAESGPEVDVVHRVTNEGALPRELAAWAVTALRPAGIAITGLPRRRSKKDSKLSPSNSLIMWEYTDLSEPGWLLNKNHVGFDNAQSTETPQKLGHFNLDTWGAYWFGEAMFLKRTKADPARRYPDLGCSFELYSCKHYLELETLSPLVELRRGESVEHIERWSFHSVPRHSGLETAEIDGILKSILLPRP